MTRELYNLLDALVSRINAADKHDGSPTTITLPAHEVDALRAAFTRNQEKRS